jgi:hypothetical protein
MVVKAYAQNIICNPGMLQLLKDLYLWVCRQGTKQQLMRDSDITFSSNQDENYHQVYALLRTILELRHQRHLLSILRGCIRHLEQELRYKSSYVLGGISYHRDKRKVKQEQLTLQLIKRKARELIWEKYYG